MIGGICENAREKRIGVPSQVKNGAKAADGDPGKIDKDDQNKDNRKIDNQYKFFHLPFFHIQFLLEPIDVCRGVFRPKLSVLPQIRIHVLIIGGYVFKVNKGVAIFFQPFDGV